MRRPIFLTAFVAGPILGFGPIPCLIYGIFLGQVATNLLWGPVFGAGFWLADFAFWAPHQGGQAIAISGLLWAFILVPIGLRYCAGLLWRHLADRGRKIALLILFLSLLPAVPVRLLNWMAVHGFILPDWALYIGSID